MFRDYYACRAWLEGFIPLVYGKEELGLARIENLLELLGNPQKKFKSIHIAGTSGKGSTAFYTAKLLQETGLRVGLHISPHLVDIRERMQIFESQSRKSKVESLMPRGRFLRLFNEIKPVVEKIKKDKPDLAPSYFEILVAGSFKYFADEKVDLAVVEVGLGGRLDATNVLKPEVSVITNIGLDHTEILGMTVEKIAYEKAGIIKAGVPLATAASGKALEVIKKAAREKRAPLVTFATRSSKIATDSDTLSYITKPFYSLRYNPISNNLANFKLAILAVMMAGAKVNQEIIDEVSKLKFAGRFEEIESKVILDGAHNMDKIKVLINFVKKSNIQHPKSIILVIAFKRGKNWKKMVDLLIKNLPVKQVIATEFNAVTDTGKFSAVPAEEIAKYVLSSKYYVVSVKTIKNSQTAVFEAMQNIQSHAVLADAAGLTKYKILDTNLVLVTGSLYLVGEARTMWELPHFT